MIMSRWYGPAILCTLLQFVHGVTPTSKQNEPEWQIGVGKADITGPASDVNFMVRFVRLSLISLLELARTPETALVTYL